MEKTAGKVLSFSAAGLFFLTAADRLEGVISPLLTGICLAVFLDPVRGFFEKRLPERLKTRQGAAVFLTLSAVTAAVCLLAGYAGEKLAAAAEEALELLPALRERTEKMALTLAAEDADLSGKALESLFSALQGAVDRLFSGGGSLLLGAVFGIWMLAGRDRILRLMERACGLFPAPERRREDLHLLRGCFSAFVRGQALEAVILGTGCLAGMLLFRKPFAGLVSLVIGLTALVPAAGAWAGAAFGALLLFSVSIADGTWFLVFIILLQQIENNLIYPRVMGRTVGLPGGIVLTAVLLGGAMFGIPGMLLFVPAASFLWQKLKAALPPA